VSAPDISFIIAAFNAAATIEPAIASALAQHGVTVEVLVVDDCSRDDTAARVAALAQSDPRIVLIRQDRNAGPSAARNRGMAAARGDWIAILDADDLLLPERSGKLLALARQSAGEIVADNAMRFLDEQPEVTWPLLPRTDDGRTVVVDIASYLRGNVMTAGDSNLGYLKPVLSRAFLRAHDIAYDERLRIGEDLNFALRALGAGARFLVTTEPFYRYRVVSGSLSRTLRPADLDALLEANDHALAGRLEDPRVKVAHAAFRRSVADLMAYSEFRGTLRQKDWRAALRLVTDPRLWLTMRQMIANANQRRRAQRDAQRGAAKGRT
jgi:succinoglycan biosynthesis protein ExoO